jgi:hypothetical protein
MPTTTLCQAYQPTHFWLGGKIGVIRRHSSLFISRGLEGCPLARGHESAPTKQDANESTLLVFYNLSFIIVHPI